MSIEAINWVLGSRRHPGLRGPKNAQRLVLLVLANHAGDTGECWPSNETIEREANVSADTRRDALAWLVERGYIARAVNGEPDSRTRADRRRNLFTLRWEVEDEHRDSPPPSDPAGGEISGVREGRISGFDAATPIPRTTSEPPQASGCASAASATTLQRANAIARRMFDGVQERTGKSIAGLNFLGVRGCIDKMLRAGWSDEAVTDALRALWLQGAPINAAVMEQQLRGTRRQVAWTRGRVDVLGGLAFDERGNLIERQ